MSKIKEDCELKKRFDKKELAKAIYFAAYFNKGNT